MSISVNIYKEITEYEEKVIFGLSLRKLITVLIAIPLSIGVGFLGNFFNFSPSVVGTIIILIDIPIYAIGFLKKNNLSYEEYFKLLIKHKFQKNKFFYETELLVDYLSKPENQKGDVKNNALSKKEKRKEKRLKEYK